MACHSCCTAAVKPPTAVGRFGSCPYVFNRAKIRGLGRQLESLQSAIMQYSLGLYKVSMVLWTLFNILMCCHKWLHMWTKNLIYVKDFCEIALDDNKISMIVCRDSSPNHGLVLDTASVSSFVSKCCDSGHLDTKCTSNLINICICP